MKYNNYNKIIILYSMKPIMNWLIPDVGVACDVSSFTVGRSTKAVHYNVLNNNLCITGIPLISGWLQIIMNGFNELESLTANSCHCRARDNLHSE